MARSCVFAKCRHDKACKALGGCQGAYSYRTLITDDGPVQVPWVLQDDDKDRAKRAKRAFAGLKINPGVKSTPSPFKGDSGK